MEESTSNSQQSLYTKLSTDYIATTLSYDRTSQTNNAPTTESGGTVTSDTMPDERRLNILIIICSMIGVILTLAILSLFLRHKTVRDNGDNTNENVENPF